MLHDIPEYVTDNFGAHYIKQVVIITTYCVDYEHACVAVPNL